MFTRPLLTVASAAATAMIFYALAPFPFIFFLVAILATHELGHFIAATTTGAEFVMPPIIFPFFPLAVGLTYIKRPVNQTLVASAGPIFGTIASIVSLAMALMLGLPPMSIGVILLALIYEMVSCFYGSDAKKARHQSP